MIFALAAAIAVVAGGLLIWNGSPSGKADVALIAAVEQQTGLLLSAESAALDPTSGTWRAEQLELRTSKDAEPVLRAKSVVLKLRVAELLRGEVRIERATLESAVLTLDLRERTAEAGKPIDRTRLAQWFPGEAEIKSASLVLRTDRREMLITGLKLALKREGDALRGSLSSLGASGTNARFVIPGQDVQASPWPVSIASSVAWTQAAVALDGLSLELGTSKLTGSAQIGDATQLALRGDDVQISDFGPLLSAELMGRGRVELELKAGTGLTAKVDLRNAAARDLVLDQLRARVEMHDDSLVLRELEGQSGLERYRSDQLTLDAALNPTGKVHVEALAISGALKRAGLTLGATGTASGDIELSSQTTTVVLELSNPAIGAYRFDSGTLDARFAHGESGPTFDISQLQLRSKVASFVVSGKAEASGKLALSGKASVSLGGRQLEIDVDVHGTTSKPETTLQLAGVEAARAGYALRAELSGTQLVRGHVELKNADFSERLPAIENAGAPFGRIDARIELTRGALDDLRAFEGQGEISKLAFGYGDARFESVARFPIALRDGRVQLRDVVLSAEGVRWTLQGELDVERGVDLSATGELPIAPLLSSTPFVESAEGNLHVALALRGADATLALTGEAQPRDVTLVIGPLKTPWTQLKGRASLEGRALRFHDVTGGFGSGTLTLSGALALAGARPRSADLKLALRKFALAPQPRFDIALDADSTLKWSAGDALPVLGGQVTLTRMHYARHVQLPEAVIALGRKSKDASEPTVAVDVLVGHRAPLTVRNDFLDVELEMTGKDKAIRVVGTDAQLGAVGELSVLRGRALFRGATLTVRRGVISFTSEKSVVPALDLLADAPAKRRPGGLVHFEAKGDPSRFDLQLRCQASGGAVPPPFACSYAGADMTCGNFAELTALWACQAP
jgi:hypothetical protein